MDYEALLKDHETIRKLEASKVRNKNLSAEIKTLKVQLATLLEEVKHNDEFVNVLLVRNKKNKFTYVYTHIWDTFYDR